MLEFTANQLAAHAIGDYLLQSDWMAMEKTKSNFAAFAHGVSYTIPFVFLTGWDLLSLLVICGSHIIIDRFRLARYVVYAKNLIAPKRCWHQWKDCSQTGYHKDRPAWLAVWLMIFADNILHLICNALAISLL